jgi:riboflavin kinase/FMN adenylyltransferase
LEIYRYTPKTKIGKPAAIALGFFDGVHEGHRRLLETAKKSAKEKKLVFTVFTFPSENALKGADILYSTEEKLKIFEELGVEAVILADFPSVATLSAEEFITASLISDMNCQVAVAGFDFRFGRGASGDARLLSSTLSLMGKECIIEDEHKINGEKISTSLIKNLLAEGRVGEAGELLGMPYFISCKAEHGNGVGKRLGFPTVNSGFEKHTPPLKRGVYRTAAEISGRLYTAVTNIGVCPTFSERALHQETHIVGYSGDLYDEEIRIFFLGYLREEKRFQSEKDLILQIEVDKNRAIKENGELKWQAIGPN